MTVTQLVKRGTAETMSVFILFEMLLMSLLISRLNGKGCRIYEWQSTFSQ